MSEDSRDGQSLRQIAIKKLKRDKLAVVSFFVIVIYAVAAILCALHIIPGFESASVSESYAPPGSKFWMGADIFGRSVLLKCIHGTKIAMLLGVAVTAIAIPVGVVLGAVAGYFGGLVDEFVTWLSTTFSSIPEILLLLSISFVLGKGLLAISIAMGMVTWVTTARLIRAEFIRQRELEYVEAAKALGVNTFSIIFRHILPNVVHIIIIQASLRFVYSIKSEVILTFIGVGIQNHISWGAMIADSQGELTNGRWWQFLATTVALWIIVYAFNKFNDALRDALDPKLRHV